MPIWTLVQTVLITLGGFLGWILGGLDGFVYALIAFVVIDYATGFMCAVVEKKLSSAVGFRGIFKKITILAMVAVGHIIDLYIIGATGVVADNSVVRTAIIFFFLSNEGLSLLENAARLGLPIPQKLKDVLSQLNGKRDENGGAGE